MGKRWRDASVDGDTDTARPIVPVRKVRRRVNYEEWRERESACVYIYTIGRTRAVNLVIKGPFCYRFNRIMLSRTDRKFGGMATHVGHRPPEISRSVRRCRVSPSSSPRPPTTLPAPFTIRRPSAAANHFYARSPFGGVRNSSRQVQSIYTYIYIYVCISKLSKLARPHTLPWRIHRIKS